MKPKVKPGYKTTEFWLSIVMSMLSLVVSYQAVAKDPSGALSYFFTSALPVIVYTVSRAYVKGNSGGV